LASENPPIPPLKKGNCEKIENNVVMSIKISIISTPQFPKIEFFHSFRGVRGELKHFGCPLEAGHFLRARSRKKLGLLNVKSV